MNRYVRQGLITDMRNGKRAVYVARTQQLARAMFEELAAEVPGDRNLTVRHAAGDERIEDRRSGGAIRCISLRRIPYVVPGNVAIAYVDVSEAHSADAADFLSGLGVEVIRP